MMNDLLYMDFIFRIRFPDMVAILNFMYHGEVNVNQEDLQNFLAAAEELRIKGLSEASSADAKLEKLEHGSVPKMKQTSGGASHGQPPTKKPRESSPGKHFELIMRGFVFNIVSLTQIYIHAHSLL